MPIGDYLTDKFLALYGLVGSLLSTVFLSPPKFVWGLSGLVLSTASLVMFLKNHWVQAQPNEWLLVIRGGKMINAGVGLKCFVSPTDNFVKFPSKVEQVSFNANNVTKQMQGVIISGFAFWSIYRDDDGPFRCYKYMQGGDANNNVQAMCESVLRNLIANSTLEEVLRNRNHLRDGIKNDLKDQLKGWGIWLESVEITEVTISSNSLFKDLQAEFRQEAQLKAQTLELDSREKMTEAKTKSEMKMTELNELNETKKMATKNNEKLKRDKQTAQYQNSKNELELKKVQRTANFQIQKMKSDLKQDQERLNNSQEIQKIKHEFELNHLRQQLALDKEHNEQTLAKYQIDSTERVYQRLGIKEIKINQFVGDGKNSLASILPQMGFAMGQLNSGNSN